MTILKATCTIPRDTGLPEDASVNTFSFFVPDAEDEVAVAELVVDRIHDFYDGDILDQVAPISSYMSILNDPAATVKVYDVALPKDSPPIYTEEITLGPFGANQLPEEVALCLSFRGDPEQGVPPARLRGRIYVGPLASSAMTVLNGRTRPTDQFCIDLCRAANQLHGPAGTTLRWGVYSAGKGTFDAVKNPDGTPDWTPFISFVTRAFVENDFDTQRRRGPGATTRFDVAIPTPP